MKRKHAWSTERFMFEAFASKGPVNRDGAQQQAKIAFETIKAALTIEERTAISTALSHAITCANSDRREFDGVCEKIRLRLFGVRKAVD